MELLTDVTPSIDTYYLFRRRICEYQERTGIDLMQMVPIKVQTIESLQRTTMPYSSRLARCKVGSVIFIQI
uniref:hypothetical protein n=1 Tax=Segatella hominis TaxID=2518605 RepID=UPI004029B0E1